MWLFGRLVKYDPFPTSICKCRVIEVSDHYCAGVLKQYCNIGREIWWFEPDDDFTFLLRDATYGVHNCFSLSSMNLRMKGWNDSDLCTNKNENLSTLK